VAQSVLSVSASVFVLLYQESSSKLNTIEAELERSGEECTLSVSAAVFVLLYQ
jgi:hypothetical protein